MSMSEPIPVPETIHNTEDLCLWLNSEGRGQSIDLQGRTLRPKGGYEKDVYGLEWHEHPHAHWYLPFLPSNTKISNGEIIASARIALICEGTGIRIENVRFEGLGDAVSDSRSALIAKNTATDLTLTNVQFKNMGFYLWEADAKIDGCSFDGGLHGLYVWGRSEVTATKSVIKNTELSGVCIRDGANVTLTDVSSNAAETGSGVWAGKLCKVAVTDCDLSGNESFGVEANHSKATVTVTNCKLDGNGKGEQDSWDGGKVNMNEPAEGSQVATVDAPLVEA